MKKNTSIDRQIRKISKSIVKKRKYKYITVTILEWIKDYLENTDHQPVGQRLPTDYTNTKAEKILESLLNGQGLGMLVMCLTNGGEYKWESIDGGHRKRAIRDFINGRFAVDGKFFGDFSQEDLADFMNIEIQLQIFENLTNEEKGILFRNINTTTKVKHQEMLNSYGDIAIANAIRETVRVVDGINNEINPLFTKDGDVGCKMKYLSIANLQLKQEEFLSRVYYRIWKKKTVKNSKYLGTASDDDLENLFNNITDEEVKKLKEETKGLLSFLKEMAIARNNTFKNKLTWKEQVSLTHVYFKMKDIFDKFKIKDYDGFYKMYNQSFVDIIEKNGENDIAKLDFEKEGLTIGVNFGNYTTEWAHEEKINQMIDWLFESNNWSFENKDMFLDLDIQRLFSKELKENTLTKQGYVCYIDGTKLDMEEAEAAHITAWSAGGRTTPDNIAMVHKKYNRDMGALNLEFYKNSGLWKKLAA